MKTIYLIMIFIISIPVFGETVINSKTDLTTIDNARMIKALQEYQEFLANKENKETIDEVQEENKKNEVSDLMGKYKSKRDTFSKLFGLGGFEPTLLVLYGYGQDDYTDKVNINSMGYVSEDSYLKENLYLMPGMTYLYSPTGFKDIALGGSLGFSEGKGSFDGLAIAAGANGGMYAGESNDVFFGAFIGLIYDNSLGVIDPFFESGVYKAMMYQYIYDNADTIKSNYSSALGSDNAAGLIAILNPKFTLDPVKKPGFFLTIGVTVSARTDWN